MRKIVIASVILGALVVAAGCEDKSSKGTGPAPSASAAASAKAAPSASAKAEAEKKKAEGPKDHVSRMKAMDEAFASHDAKKVGALYAEDAVIKSPGRPDLKGREAIEKRLGENFAAFKDMSVQTGRVWEKDKHTAVVEWLDKGTSTGDWAEMGIAKATHKPFGVMGAAWIEVGDDGLIKEQRNYLDSRSVVAQVLEDKKAGVRPAMMALSDGTTRYEATASKEKEAKDPKEKAELAKAADVEKKDLEAEDKYVGFMNTNKVDDALKLVADDFKLVDYTEEKDVAGKKAFKDMLHMWMTAFPGMKVKSTASFADGDFVVEEFEYTGVQKGALGPIKATNKPVDIHQLEIDELKDGKLVKAWSFGNGNEMLSQLGVMPDKKDEKKDEKKK